MSSQATAGRETLVNTFTTGKQEYATVAALANGGWVVAWESNGQLGNNYGAYQQLYAADGSRIGSETQADSYVNPYKYYQHASVVALADGGWVVTWETDLLNTNNVRSVYQQRYDADGSKAGSETLINTYTLGYLLEGTLKVTGLTGGGSVIAWESYDEDSYGVYQQRVDADGNPVGNAAVVETNITGGQFSPSLAGLADGGWVTTWSTANGTGNSTDIHQQRYDADGMKVGGENQVSAYFTTGSRDSSSVASLADGGWVVTWVAMTYVPRTDGGSGLQPDYDIYQQRYGANGAAMGANALVNTTTASYREFQSIAGLSDGGWVVAWSSYDIIDGGWDVFQQRYAANGLKLGAEVHEASSETLVNAHTTNSQYLPTVAALSDGGWIVTWMSEGQDNKDGFSGIYQRHYAPDIYGTPGSDKLAGTAWAEYIMADAGNDTLGGRGGADVMVGGLGNDTYIVDNAGASVQENAGEGTDLVKASVSYTLSSNLENLTLKGSKDIGGTGNGLDNVLTGNSGKNSLKGLGGNDTISGGAGNDTLDGGSGTDIMTGGKGNDSYVVDNAGDSVQETVGGGTDFVKASISYALGSNVENLTLTGSGNIDGTGNSLANRITGNSHNNILKGGNGNDALNGGTGGDVLTGGAGKDTFIFALASDSTTAANGRDLITDFSRKQHDQIDLHLIDANGARKGEGEFDFIGTHAFGGNAGELRYETRSGDTFVYADINGDKKADFSIQLDTSLALKEGDFML